MNDVESTQSAPERRNARRRMWLPIAALTLAAAGLVSMETVFANSIDRGGRNSISFLILVLALAVVAGWFFFGAGVSRRARGIAALLLGAGALFAVTAVRRVEFSGDMVPAFDFRWSPDRSEVLEQHRAQQRAEYKTAAAADGRLPLDITVAPDDVLEYRGTKRDGVIAGPALARDWSKSSPKLVWRQPVGGGYASFLVIGGVLVTIEQRRNEEAVVAYDADTGRELWAYAYPALFSEAMGGDGPRSTPTFQDGKLYALGATGELTSLELATGKPNWSVNILKQNESGNLDWGMSGSPLVYDGIVLVNPGTQKGDGESRAVVAYGLDGGHRQWGGGGAKASYASPMLVTLGGLPQVLIFDAAGLAGHDASDGRPLWRFDWKSDFDINAAQPVVLADDRVLITSASGAALVQVGRGDDGNWSANEIWRSRAMKGGYASPVVYGEYLYGLDENMLACVDLANGKRMWKSRGGQYGHGQLLLRDDLILVLGEAGELALVEANPKKFHELGRIQAIDGKTWNVPTLVGRRIFVRNHLEMAAYDLPLADEVDAAQNDTASQTDETTKRDEHPPAADDAEADSAEPDDKDSSATP